MAGDAAGFEYARYGERVEVRHHGRLAATLRGEAAARFLTDIARRDPQQVMARVTGDYRRGNERSTRHRP
ncbi:hypothetical protein [Microbacterium flavum]|uniref:Uncharacterized protein n=1 Tax=Microbacterium flavum TaxID=415216 RepID=A0ABS5XSU9_9MICO|nr:hypothetical protein [Microbacterium flavum]MBT8797244.1 hypothetical protein [Microbacterium flavum]